MEKIKNSLSPQYNIIFAVKKRDDIPVFLSEEIYDQIGYSADLSNISSISQSTKIQILSDRIATSLKSKIPFALLMDDAEMKTIDIILLDKLKDFIQKSKSIIIIASRSGLSLERFVKIKLKPFGLRNTSKSL